MKKHVLFALCVVLSGVAIGADVSLKAQHTIGASSTVFAVQTTKNTTKGNMLSVIKKSNGAITLSTPTIDINRELVSPGDSMTPGAAISAGVSGSAAYPAQSLDFITIDGTQDFQVDGTPNVGTGGAVATIEMACVSCDPVTGDWVTLGTVASETTQSAYYTEIGICIGDYGASPCLRAARGSIKSNIEGYPW